MVALPHSEIEVRRLNYQDLLNCSHSQIVEITSSGLDFVIFTPSKVGHRIQRFLAAQSNFNERRKSLSARVDYVFGSLPGLLVPGFMPIWNRAVMDGYRVVSIDSALQNTQLVVS